MALILANHMIPDKEKQELIEQDTTTITIRTTKAEKARIRRGMQEEGFDNISPFIIWIVRKFLKQRYF